MIGKFEFIWKCPSQSLDLTEAEAFCNFIEKNKNVQSDGDFLLINLEKVRFVTLLGIISLSAIISRAVAYGFTVTVSLPSYDPVKVFIHYFGFVDILDMPRRIGAVVIPEKISLKKPSNGKKVFSSKPIYSYHDADQFVNYTQIKEWINQLDQDIRECDFFRTGKFARVVSAELGLNIVHHANLLASAQEGRESFGVVAMRVIKESGNQDLQWVHKTFPSYKAFTTRHIKNGFVEVCICDPGQGIKSALEASYKARMIEKGFSDAIPEDPVNLTRQIIEFAFDEFGTSKVNQEQWITDAHALSRVLTLVNAYSGILELTTSNIKAVYRLDENPLVKGDKSLGYKANEVTRFLCPVGTNIRILVPLGLSTRPSAPPKTVNISAGGAEPSIVAVATEYSVEELAKVPLFIKRTDCIGSFIQRASSPGVLVLDFTNCRHWRSDHFATLIDRLWNLLCGRLALIVGIDPDLASDIETRCYNSAERTEKFYHDTALDDEGAYMHYLACLTDLHHVLPAIDTEGNVHWFGSHDASVSDICSRILDCSVSEDEIERQNKTGQSTSSNILTTLRSTYHLFFSKKNNRYKNEWHCRLNTELVETLRGKVLVEHLDRHLQQISEALWGKMGNQAFLLPHSKRYVGTFIEATRLLQEEEFSREVGEVLARLVWTSLQKSDPTVLIATTAPSLLLANSIRRYFKELPLIVDIGHYFDSPKKVVLESLCRGNSPHQIVVVQDITHSGQTLEEICEALEQYGNTVDAVVTLIELTDEVSALTSGGARAIEINGETKSFISLYRYPTPKQLTINDLKRIKEDDIFWIEPYSLHPFRISELKKAGYQYLRGNNPTVALGSHVQKLEELEENDVLRFGHFVYEDHHFSLVTRMLQFFESSSLADKLVDEIVASCDAVSGQLTFIFPLHSHIRYLVPKLLDRLASRSVKPSHFYPVVARELGHKPYYMAPYRLEKLLSAKYEERVNSETTSKLNVVVVDDTAASLRTFETILRSVYLASVKPVGKVKPIDATEIINKVDVWAVINRAGRAKSTFLNSVGSWLGVPFKFHCFAEYDIPVYEDRACPVCLEYRHLQLASKLLEVGGTASLKQWVTEQLELLRPVIVDSPAFDELPSEEFPNGLRFVFNSYTAKSMPLACLNFLEVAERGCPARYLIDALREFTNQAGADLEHPSVSKFREFVISWFIINWKKVASDASADDYYRLLDDELRIRPKTSLKVLLTCSMYRSSLPDKAFDTITRKILLLLTTLSVLAIKSPTIENMESREIIFNAIILLRAAMSVNNLDTSFVDLKISKWFEDLPDDPVPPGDFQGSIKDVVKASFTFLPGSAVSTLDCIKLASMELLIPPFRAEGAARIHYNRIYKHLRELITPDVNEKYISIITKIKGSVGFLDVRSKLLCRAIGNIICGRVDEATNLRSELIAVEELFVSLSSIIKRLDINKFRADEILSSPLFLTAQKIAVEIEQRLFTKTSLLYREVDAYNVKYWEVIDNVVMLAKKRKVANRLTIPSRDECDAHTVFGDDFEVLNFLVNHTVDVLEKHSDISISIAVSEYCNGESLLISINSHSVTGNARKNIYEGHGFRFERWGLNRFGGEVYLEEGISESDVTVNCRLLHGYI